MAPSESKTIPLRTVRWRLTYLWFIGSGIIFLVLIIPTFGRPEQSDPMWDVWSRALPMFVPTLGLFIAVLGEAAVHKPGDGSPTDELVVDRNFSQIAFFFSLFYLGLISVILIVYLFRLGRSTTNIDLKQINTFLSPVQGLLTAVLGYLFSTSSASTPPGGGGGGSLAHNTTTGGGVSSIAATTSGAGVALTPTTTTTTGTGATPIPATNPSPKPPGTGASSGSDG